jgi:hypothetical protein
MPGTSGKPVAFMQQLTDTHVNRWKEHRHETGHPNLANQTSGEQFRFFDSVASICHIAA